MSPLKKNVKLRIRRFLWKNVEFVKMEGNIAYVKLKGSCHGCPMAQMTLKNGIEKYLKDNIPELEGVESV